MPKKARGKFAMQLAIQTKHPESLVRSGYKLIENTSIPHTYVFEPPLLLKRGWESDERIDFVEEQIPYRHLYKRGRISYVRQKLNITDPGFSQQWHLVSHSD
jgi:hypothetical protein